MVSITNQLTSSVKKNINQHLAVKSGFRTLASATVPSLLTKCGLKTHHYKSMPGSPFGDLVTVASFQPHLRRAVLCLSHPIYLTPKLATMNKQPSFEQRLDAPIRQIDENNKVSAEIARNLLPPDNSDPALVQFDKPFSIPLKSVYYAN